MIKTIQFKGIDLYYQSCGNKTNPCIVLIHGYLESHKIYEGLARELQDKFCLIVPDLPGHGLSGVYSEKHSMEEMAEAVKMVMEHCGIEKAHLAGHSMGGYVVMAFRELYPESLLSFSLINSHCFADSDEKKRDRQREIEMIHAGKKELIVRTSIPRIFATDNLELMKDEVERSIAIAMATPDEGIIALLNGMKDRPDRSGLLKEGSIRSYLFAGMKDNLIPVEMADRISDLATNMKRFDFENSGHMCFVEERERVVEVIRGDWGWV